MPARDDSRAEPSLIDRAASPVERSVPSTTTLRQAVTPGELLGRVSAVIVTATYGSRPVGAAIGASVGGAYGAEVCILVAALGFLVQALLILTSPVPRLVRQPGLVG